MVILNEKIIGDLANFIKLRYKIDIAEESRNNPELLKSFLRLQHHMNDALLGVYFQANENAEEEGTYWVQQIKWNTRRTGQMLLEKINALNPEKILDVGCGDNEWKQHFGDKLLGIDPYNINADQMIDVMDLDTNVLGQYDVVLALGSINFGDEKAIRTQVEKVVSMTKSGGKIYWRCNPGITHDNEHAYWINFYPWSEEKLREFANDFGCTVNEIGWDHMDEDDEIRWGNRLYSEWTKQ